jgi:lipopolysaccharide export system permease protein
LHKWLWRIEASIATLTRRNWIRDNARTIRPDQFPQPPELMNLPTDLTVNRVQESFASPDTLSFWALPGFIGLLDRSGFSSIRHRLHFHARSLCRCLRRRMTLVSAGFSMRPARRGGVVRIIGSGVIAGFALFVVSKFAEEIGQSGPFPVILAAWAPAASGLMLAVALLLHTEDG